MNGNIETHFSVGSRGIRNYCQYEIVPTHLGCKDPLVLLNYRYAIYTC